jgi:hypothetical protein
MRKHVKRGGTVVEDSVKKYCNNSLTPSDKVLCNDNLDANAYTWVHICQVIKDYNVFSIVDVSDFNIVRFVDLVLVALHKEQKGIVLVKQVQVNTLRNLSPQQKEYLIKTIDKIVSDVEEYKRDGLIQHLQIFKEAQKYVNSVINT